MLTGPVIGAIVSAIVGGVIAAVTIVGVVSQRRELLLRQPRQRQRRRPLRLDPVGSRPEPPQSVDTRRPASACSTTSAKPDLVCSHVN